MKQFVAIFCLKSHIRVQFTNCMNVHCAMVHHPIVPFGNLSHRHVSFCTPVGLKFSPHAELASAWPLPAFFGTVSGIQTPRPFVAAIGELAYTVQLPFWHILTL